MVKYQPSWSSQITMSCFFAGFERGKEEILPLKEDSSHSISKSKVNSHSDSALVYSPFP